MGLWLSAERGGEQATRAGLLAREGKGRSGSGLGCRGESKLGREEREKEGVGWAGLLGFGLDLFYFFLLSISISTQV